MSEMEAEGSASDANLLGGSVSRGESAKYCRQTTVINSSALNLDAGFGCDLIVASKRILKKFRIQKNLKN